MSGYTQDVVDQAGVLEEGLTLVQKPFRPEQLAAALRQALARAGGPGPGARAAML
jgi:DNA-binding response OmpR family regulator